MDTDIEIFLAQDYGRQDNSFFTISPESRSVSPGTWAEWKVTLQSPPCWEVAAPTTLLLRPLPVVNRGVRKHFRIQNVGCGPLDITARTKAPWSLVVDAEARECGAGCGCGSDAPTHRECQVALCLMPRSSMEMCVEVCVRTAEAWPAPSLTPCQSAPYDQWRRTLTKLRFYDTYNVLQTLPLHLELEYPVISIEPALLDFGFVTDGDTRKSYFTVSHSSRTATIDMVTEWAGGKEFRLWPRDFSLQPGGRERVYIQYTARWCGAPVEGCVRVSAACGAGRSAVVGEESAGGWCRVAARARGTPARDADRKLHVHDHTDDTHLLATDLASPSR